MTQKNKKPERGNWIITPRPGTPVDVIALEPEWIGLQLHWTDGTVPCNGPGKCPYCATGNRIRWKGYICVETYNTHLPAILEFTASCWPTMHRANEGAQGITGMRLQLFRTKLSIRSRIELRLSRPTPDTRLLNKPWNIQQALERLWQMRLDWSTIQQYAPYEWQLGLRGWDPLKKPSEKSSYPTVSGSVEMSEDTPSTPDETAKSSCTPAHHPPNQPRPHNSNNANPSYELPLFGEASPQQNEQNGTEHNTPPTSPSPGTTCSPGTSSPQTPQPHSQPSPDKET